MADVKMETVTVPAKTYVPAEFQTTGFVPTGEADEVKAFVWSDTSGLVPLIEADVK